MTKPQSHLLTTDPWSVGADGVPGVALGECLAAAIRAPSVFNSQPWRFHAGHGFVDLYADDSRRLPVVDPAGREQAISLGAALFNLRVAVLRHHRTPLVRLLPDPSRPDLAARVTLGPATRPDATVLALAAAIPRRHTNRRPFTAVPIPDDVLAELSAAGDREGARLTVLDEPARRELLALVRSADVRLRRDPRYRDELTTWTSGDTGRPDGVSRPEFGPWDALETLPLRDFGLTRTTEPRRSARFEPDPTMVVVSTATDGPEQWLRAGQALERLLLTATVRGLATTPTTQPLEIPQLRALVGAGPGAGVAQVILRVGYGPASPASSRRPVSEVLVDAP
jgi:nitroreductase